MRRAVLIMLACVLSGPSMAELPRFEQRLVLAALERTQHSVRYDGSYLRLGYPGGDVPANIGVCSDVIIRSYRALGIDLQQLVHEDMRAHFSSYPSQRIWGLTRPDSNIDHRRVPNLQTFFKRFRLSTRLYRDLDAARQPAAHRHCHRPDSG